MATTSEARALPFFTDLQGQPLASGSIYIGQPGLDPVAYPAVVTSDSAGQIVLSQPIRTTNGHAVSAGSQVHMFCPTPYSITVLDAAGRITYASLNETDPTLTTLSNSSVQSAADLATLRARSGQSTNQVWVDGFGMYVYNPTDNTSPENIPFVIVGSDGSRYDLSQFDANLGFAKVSKASPSYAQQGCWFSWNDDGVNGATYLTNNKGNGVGGFLFRTMTSDGSTEIGSLSIAANGALHATSDIHADGSLIAGDGIVALNTAGTRSVQYDGTHYSFPSADLLINGALAITENSLSSELVTNNLALKVGSYTLGTATMPTPGTWTVIATINSVWLWLRTA